MRSSNIRSTRSDRTTPVSRQQPAGPPAQHLHGLPPSPWDDLHILIAKRAYQLYCERGYRDGAALDDWLDAEREILSQIPSVSQTGDGHA